MSLCDSSVSPACPSRASGWVTHPLAEISRVASDLPVPTCRRHYPGGTVGGIESLPGNRRQRPSPRHWRVGSHVEFFEACSAFSHVTACLLAESLTDPFHRRLRQGRRRPCRPDGYRRVRPLPGGNCTHWRSTP